MEGELGSLQPAVPLLQHQLHHQQFSVADVAWRKKASGLHLFLPVKNVMKGRPTTPTLEASISTTNCLSAMEGTGEPDR